MPQHTVRAERTTVEHLRITVDADDLADAQQQALEAFHGERSDRHVVTHDSSLEITAILNAEKVRLT